MRVQQMHTKKLTSSEKRSQFLFNLIFLQWVYFYAFRPIRGGAWFRELIYWDLKNESERINNNIRNVVQYKSYKREYIREFKSPVIKGIKCTDQR